MVTCKGYNSARLNIFKTTFSKKYMHIERKTLHKPVLLKELVSFAEKNECQYIVDATFGGGGYSESFLRMTHGPKVHALDIDNSVMQNVNIVHENFGSKFSFSHISFSMMNTIFDRHSQKPDCIVFDLGISTDQVCVFKIYK